MPKFKMRFKIEKLELEIEGSREDIPLMTQAAGQQFAGMLSPASNVIEGEIDDSSDDPPILSQSAAEKTPQKKRSAKKRVTSTSSGTNVTGNKIEPVMWRHDSSNWGTPKQAWSTSHKSLWTMYVVMNVAERSELTASVIAATFNKNFQQAGRIISTNVTRDLGKLKLERPAIVSEDTTKTPSTWYLTQEGILKAQQLVIEAKGGSEAGQPENGD